MSASLFAAVLAAFLVGLGGSAHCALMCGGISAAVGAGTGPRRRVPLVLLAQLGRILSYALAGSLMAALGATLLAHLASDPARRSTQLLLGLAWMAMALRLSGLWAGSRLGQSLTRAFWQRLQPLTRRVWPIRTPIRAVAAGALWGWLPCGMSYAMLLVAAASADPGPAALLMLAFGIGTVPTLLIPALAVSRLQGFVLRPLARHSIAALMFAFGLFIAIAPWLGNSLPHHHHHIPPAQSQPTVHS
ncbi:MAG: sulfite exporter TauE/SafE family protein [Lysobacterales bacterium]